MYKIAKTLCNTDNHVCTGLTCKFEMEKNGKKNGKIQCRFCLKLKSLKKTKSLN